LAGQDHVGRAVPGLFGGERLGRRGRAAHDHRQRDLLPARSTVTLTPVPGSSYWTPPSVPKRTSRCPASDR
jgi:hypothetical protein